MTKRRPPSPGASPGAGPDRKKVPPPASEHPDGGYGWVIVLAYSLNTVLIIQICTLFGLIFRDTFRELKIEGTDLASIMNLNIAFSLLLGISNGAMIRSLGYRKMAAIGAAFACVGMVLTSTANSFIEFLIYYGLLQATGTGLCSPAFNVALSSYFRRRRSLAFGVAMTTTGLASICMPQLVSVLLTEYGARGTSLMFAGLALNGLVAAALLQPVAWHRKHKPTACEVQVVEPEPEKVEEPEKIEEADGLLGAEVDEEVAAVTWQWPTDEDDDQDDQDEQDDDEERQGVLQTMPPPLPVLKEETDADLEAERTERHNPWGSLLWSNVRRRSSAVSSTYFTARGGGSLNTLWASASVLELGTSAAALDQLPDEVQDDVQDEVPVDPYKPEEPVKEARRCSPVSEASTCPASPASPAPSSTLSADKPGGPGVLKRFAKVLVDFFDLSLLQNPSILNLMLGVSFAFFSEMNFAQFTPFILAERGLDTPRIATFMSIIAIADTSSRFAAPFVHKAMGLSSKFMYMLALSILSAARLWLLLLHDDDSMIIVMVTIGVSKGFRSVFYWQVIPDSVPLDRLAAAIGLQAVLNGVIFVALGPVLGVIQERTGRYDSLIVACNAFTMLAVLMWLVEFTLNALARRRARRDLKEKSFVP